MAKFDCIADFEDLTPAEEELIDACRNRERCVLSQERPTEQTVENTIRAALLRVLITGGTSECRLSDYGVWLSGAWITEALDLTFQKARGPTNLVACVFEKKPDLAHSQLTFLNLENSKLPGLSARRMEVTATVELKSLDVNGTIELAEAHIGGQLICTGAKFDGGAVSDDAKGWNFALNAQSITVLRDVFLDDAEAIGTIGLPGANVSGQIVFNRSSFDGKGGRSFNGQGIKIGSDLILRGLSSIGSFDLNGAMITGQLVPTGASFNGGEGTAFEGQSLTVLDGFIWREITPQNIIGRVYLANAKMNALVDDISCWPHDIILNGLSYDHLHSTQITAQERLPWLANGSNHNGVFHPQPYTQLAKVLFAMGHDREAKKILMARENRLSMVALQNLRVKPNGGTYLVFENPLIDAQVCGAKAWFWTIGLLAGHGYAPFRALVAMLALIAVTTFLAYQAWSTGAFAPNSDVIVTSEAWQLAMMNDCVPAPFPGCEPNPALTWSNDRAQGIDWAAFNALAYAADLALPVVELGQTSAWAPSKDRGVWGETLWWSSWWIELLGWLFTVLGGAAITGLIQRSRE